MILLDFQTPMFEAGQHGEALNCKPSQPEESRGDGADALKTVSGLAGFSV